MPASAAVGECARLILALGEHAGEFIDRLSTKLDACNEYKVVIADYTEAIKLTPNDPLGYFQRGTLRHHIGEQYKAVQDLEEALRLGRQAESETFITIIEQALHEVRQVLRNTNTRS